MDRRVAIVRDGYDAMSDRYLAWAGKVEDPHRSQLVDRLDGLLADGSEVLDLGCGNGLPTARQLARRHTVSGVDVSSAQIALARSNVPDASFECIDLLAVDCTEASLDAVVALYSLTHVPREFHVELLGRVRRWLRPGGHLLATLSARNESDGAGGQFVGVPMYFSGFDAEHNRALVREAGFDLLVDDVATLHEPEGEVAFLWVLARA